MRSQSPTRRRDDTAFHMYVGILVVTSSNRQGL